MSDDFDDEVEVISGPGLEFAGVDTVGRGAPDAAAGALEVVQQWVGGVAVLDRGGGGQHFEQQAESVGGSVAFAAVDFLALSQPREALGTVAAARTDWELITAAVGSAWRPAAMRAAARNASCSATVTFLTCHRWYRP
jgi:hypothetical protein